MATNPARQTRPPKTAARKAQSHRQAARKPGGGAQGDQGHAVGGAAVMTTGAAEATVHKTKATQAGKPSRAGSGTGSKGAGKAEKAVRVILVPPGRSKLRSFFREYFASHPG
jgi:hypothetical protein